MKLGIDHLVAWIRKHYDRSIALVVLLGLASTIVVLVTQIGLMRQRQADFAGWMRGLRPANERVAQVEPDAFAQAMAALEQPPQLPEVEGDDDWMFVPQSRFSCSECGHPVPEGAEDCPFCGAPVTPPEPATVDHDEDGMPTNWEAQYGLDSADPTDAEEDRDGDGFTNLEEYQYATDPTDAESHPDLLAWLVVDRVEGRRFGLQFRSRVRTQGGYRFGINYMLPSGETKTDFVEIGESVTGFELESYTERRVASDTGLGTVDRSELTIVAPTGQRIVLVKDQPVLHVELTAHLRVEREAEQHQMEAAVRKDKAFSLQGTEYEVIEIDAEAKRVILKGVSGGEPYVVTTSIRAEPVVEPMQSIEDDLQEQDMHELGL